MTKYLLGGISLTGLSSGLVIYGAKDVFPSFKKELIDNSLDEEEDSEEQLIERAGLVCRGDYC